MTALLLALLSLPATITAAVVPPQPVYGYVSAFSCDDHQNNTMYPCGAFRDGSTPHSDLHGLVAACPLERLGQRVRVAGIGVVECRDTPRNGWVNGMEHIDLFMGYEDALRWSIQTVEIEWIAPIVGQEAKRWNTE